MTVKFHDLEKEYPMDINEHQSPKLLGKRLLEIVKLEPYMGRLASPGQKTASEEEKLIAITEFIKKGADINVEDENQETTLHWAAF